jgi:hypothetical protein
VAPETHRTQLDHLSARLAESFATEREDYDAVVPWMRHLVVLRGLCDRALIRHRMQQCRSQMGLLDEATVRIVPGDRTPFNERTARHALDRDSYPQWLTMTTHEGKQLGAAIWRQVRARITPRISALAGLAAGWWVASTYTDSHLRSILSTVGISHGGTHVVSSTTYRAMSFWLPILAAATCAYVGDRLARAVGNRDESGTKRSIAPNQ